MQATRTPADGPDTWSAPPSDEEFLSRYGDTIDDRVAEILAELLEERNAARQRRRLPRVLGAVAFLLALAATIPLRHTAIAWTIWPATAVICLAAAWSTRTRKP